jgi:hypothetical protein
MATTKKKASKRAAPRELDASDEAAALWELCEEHAGRVPELESTLLAAVAEKGPEADAMQRSIDRGDASTLNALYTKLSASIDPALREYFEALVREGREHPAEHPSNTPGALCFLGLCMDDWAEYEAFVSETLGPLAQLDRLRRLELAVCAARRIESHADNGGLAFLRREAERWAAQVNARTSDTALSALAFLLRREDKPTAKVFAAMLERAVPDERTERTLSKLRALHASATPGRAAATRG